VFDYGAPIGFNLAVANPDGISAIISQNGNAYEERLGAAAWAPLRAYWTQPSPASRETIKERMSLDGVRESYFQGVSDPARIEPEAYWLDAALLLAMWGKNDTFFIPPGAEAFKRDVPDADVRFLDAGHFALETNVDDFASAILKMPVNA